MALSITAIITLRAPQFSGDARITDLIELAKLQTATNGFGDRYNLAVALRVLHMLTHDAMQGGSTSSGGSAVSGAVTSEREGQLARSFGQSRSAMDKWGDLSSTSFGMELIELINSTFMLPRTSYMDNTEIGSL